MVTVYGKLSEENMNNIISDFSKRPETAALVSPEKGPNNIGEEFYKSKNQ